MIDKATRPAAPLFPLGQTVATPGALAALAGHPGLLHRLVARHARGDYGDVNAEDRKANEMALVHGERLLSSYTTPTGDRLWIITEANRSLTCVLTPDEY